MKAFEQGKWIWNESCVPVNSYGEFAAVFESADMLRIACDGNYALYINEELISFGQYPGYEDLQFYDEIELSGCITQGENRLRIVVHHPGKDTSTYRNGQAGVIFELLSGSEVVLASSEETLSRPCPIYDVGEKVGVVSPQLGFTFGMDLTRQGGAFTPSVVVDRSPEFSARPISKLELLPDAPAKSVMTGEFADTTQEGTAAARMYAANLMTVEHAGQMLPSDSGLELKAEKGDGCLAVFDLGREEAGILSLDIEVDRECELIVGWGEHLTDNRVRARIGIRSFGASIRLRAGRNRILHPLLRMGLRYLELHVYAPGCRVFYAGVRPTPYPLREAGVIPNVLQEMPGDVQLHKRIYDTCVRTLALCMHEHYEDCPWREQALYSMDSRNQMLCGYHAFGETVFARASLGLMAHSIREDGLLELCSPARVAITIPCFSAVFPLMVKEYLDYSGDQDFVQELMPALERITETFIRRIEDNGLIRCFGERQYWDFYEWQEGLDGSIGEQVAEEDRSFDAPLCAFVLMGLEAYAAIGNRLGSEHAQKSNQVCTLLKESMQVFWNEEQGCYASFLKGGRISHYCELTNALMLAAGAVPEERQNTVRTALMSGRLTEVTLSHSIFKYDALLEDAENVEWVLNDIAQKWGYMLEQGATSFWETIAGDGDFDKAGSLCHGWSAIPIHIYQRIADSAVNSANQQI